MDHNYIESMLKAGTCGLCKRPEIDHTDRATCECCSNSGSMTVYLGMLMCSECIDKERALQTESKKNAENRVMQSNLSIQAELDRVKHEILDRTDIFNAKIPSLVDIQAAVDNDPTIENKTFEKARVIIELFNHLKSVISESRKVLDNAVNMQRASQSELNQLASQLRQEERDKLKLQDINYKPTAPKLIKPRTVNNKPKIDKIELMKYAQELQVPPSTLQSMVVRRGCSVADAAKILKDMLGN